MRATAFHSLAAMRVLRASRRLWHVTGGAVVVALLSGHHSSLNAASGAQTPSAANRSELIAVTSKDGTRIGVECAGTGPTLLLVHGGVGDRTRWTPMFPLLASKFTACAMDRRGRGASGDSREYSLSKEAEDVAAVVNSRPGPVFVLGHSYGGVAALEATFLTDRIARLMLYEPPLHEPVGNNLAVATKVEALIKKGELEQAFIAFQTEIVKQSPEELARMKARPTWNGLVATIAVHPRQMRALSAYRFDANRMKSVRMPTLLLLGEETASPYAKQSIAALREWLPNPTLVVLERQEHNAMDGGREVLANAITKFAAPQE
jgi:pimeloyl-ACP methyl ester carboxylesterase